MNKRLPVLLLLFALAAMVPSAAQAGLAGAVFHGAGQAARWGATKIAKGGWRMAKKHPVGTIVAGGVVELKLSGQNPFKGLAESAGSWLNDAITIVRQSLSGVEKKAEDGALNAGYTLMFLFMLIAVAMLGLNWLLDGDLEDVIKGGFELAMVCGLALWFMDDYGYVFKDGLIGSFGDL